MHTEQMIAGDCTIQVVQGDITRIAVDAIVNAANSMLAGGGGVDGAIHAAAGPTVMRELHKYEGCATGSAVVTGAGQLPAKFIIHAVGPVFRGGHYGEAELLASCYKTSLELAHRLGCESISFPAISTGLYGYPIAEAASIALTSIIRVADGGSTLRTVKLVQHSEGSHNLYCEVLATMVPRHKTVQTS